MVTSPYSKELSTFDLLSSELLSCSSSADSEQDVELYDIADLQRIILQFFRLLNCSFLSCRYAYIP